MTKKRWFRFYTDAWLRGTFGLNPNEIAAYITILCELYDRNGFAPLDLDIMSRRCGMRPTSFRKALDTLIQRGKLSLDGGFLTSKAVSEEIESREKLNEKSGESRRNRAEKDKEIKAIREKISSNKEYRIQNNPTTSNVEALPPLDDSLSKLALSPAVAGFVKRREIHRRKVN